MIERAVILAGGKGTRLKPLTDITPKPLIEVKGEPIVTHLVRFFQKHGVWEFGIIISRNHERQFQDWVATIAPRATYTFFREEKPMGTFGYLGNLKNWTGGKAFFMMNGDSLLDFDLTELAEFHATKKRAATIGLIGVPHAGEFGSVVLKDGIVQGFEEKSSSPKSNLVSVGLYLLEPDIFAYGDPSRDFLMIEKDVFPKMAHDGNLSGFVIPNGRFFDCGTLARLEQARKEW